MPAGTRVSLLSMKSPHQSRIFDGIGVVVECAKGDQHNTFYFHSPQRHEYPAIYKILDATFDLANQTLPKEEVFMEDVQQYFHMDSW